MPKKVSRKLRPAAKKSKRLPNRKLWDSPALVAAIVDSSDDAIIGKTLDGMITSWNPGAERIYGYRAGEVIGKSISILAPEDRGDEIPTILEKIRRGQRVEHYESVRVTKDKRRLDVSMQLAESDRHAFPSPALSMRCEPATSDQGCPSSHQQRDFHRKSLSESWWLKSTTSARKPPGIAGSVNRRAAGCPTRNCMGTGWLLTRLQAAASLALALQ